MNYTDLTNAFDFSTTIPKMRKQTTAKPQYIPVCIYCNNPDTIALLNDGSFRRCKNRSCRKDFQAKIQLNDETIQPSFPGEVKFATNNSVENNNNQRYMPATPIPKHPNEFIMNQPRQLINQQSNNNCKLFTLQDTSMSSFSRPDFAVQLKK